MIRLFVSGPDWAIEMEGYGKKFGSHGKQTPEFDVTTKIADDYVAGKVWGSSYEPVITT